MIRKILGALFVLGLTTAILGGLGIYWGYLYVTRDLPHLFTIDDYKPNAVTSVYSRDGTLIAEFYKQKRYPVKLKEVPLQVRQAFLAAEDVNFYQHPGIDPMSIVRAMVRNWQSGSASQGGSTITQQVVKNLLLTPEKKLTRKLKEAILSYRIEKRLSKDDILEIYLNEIYFGNNAYGIKSAARTYFHKELPDLSLSEAAILASLPKAPSTYSPTNKSQSPKLKRRQKYVLEQMLKAHFITAKEEEDADNEKIQAYHHSAKNIFAAPYYVTEVRTAFQSLFKNIDIDTAGLKVVVPVDLEADALAAKALRAGLRNVDKRRGWRGIKSSILNADHEAFLREFADQLAEAESPESVYPAMIVSVNKAAGTAKVDLGKLTTTVDLRPSWAQRKREKHENVVGIKLLDQVKVGDVIEVALKSPTIPEAGKPVADANPYQLDQTPDIEGAITLLDPHSGRVLAVIGGYDFTRSQFNRATQSLRQPGSSFKPVVYLTAVDSARYTPATIVYDTPRSFRWGTQVWAPHNFDGKFMGPITLQTALEQSRNLVSADIVSRIGLDRVIEYAQKLGIKSPIGRNLSISLGSSEVMPLELTRAYGVFASGGMLFDSSFLERVEDRNGNILYDQPVAMLKTGRRVISEKSAFTMAMIMTGTIERGTATSLKSMKRVIAGKTGTTNNQMDAWFIGYTPDFVCSIWVGFDQKKEIGNKETGGKVSAPIFKAFMSEYLNSVDARSAGEMKSWAESKTNVLGVKYPLPEQLSPRTFPVPEGMDPFWMNRKTGHISPEPEEGSIIEYFDKDDQRTVESLETSSVEGQETSSISNYLESDEL